MADCCENLALAVGNLDRSTQHSALAEDPSALAEERPVREPLRYKTARAALTSGGGELITRVLTVVLSIVTARMLEPRDVGLLGIGVILIGIVSMLASFPITAGFTTESSDSDSRHALSASLLRAVVTAILIVAVILNLDRAGRYLGVDAADLKDFTQLLLILSWLPILELLNAYPQVLLQRKLDLNYYAWMASLQPVILVSMAIILLMSGQGYRGIAWANVAATGTTAALVWLRLWRRRWLEWSGWPSQTNWHATLITSGKLFVGGVGGYLGERMDNLLVAGALGPAAMSFYSMAWTASRTPANVFARAINFVLVPTLARLGDEPERVRRALIECLRHSYALLAPACSILFVSAPLLVTYVIGPKWLPLVPALRVMCFTALAIPMLFAMGALFVGSGRAHLSAIGSGVHIIALIITIPPLSRRGGVTGAAWADLISTLLMTVAMFTTARLTTRQLVRFPPSVLLLPVVAALLAGAGAWALGSFVSSDPLRLVVQAGSLISGYAFLMTVLGGRAGLRELTDLLYMLFRRRQVASGPGI